MTLKGIMTDVRYFCSSWACCVCK